MVCRGVIAAAFAALLVVCAAPAHAMVDVPDKAIWSVTDVDSMQFCEPCNVNNLSSEQRRDNYTRVIEDTVSLGARAIIVQAVTGASTQTHLAEFFQSLKTYADANPSAGVCGALMYADYGTAHPNDQIDAQWSTAWTDSGTGAVYCSIGGKPVVATLEDRPDFACQLPKYTNIFTLRISKLPGGSSGFNWVAAFGESSEFADWQSKCQGKITGVTSSYLEMANDDPAAGAAATTRSSAVVAGGGRYILGIPTASGRNCGNFCNDGSDATANTNIDFSGFARILAAWRSGIQQLAYTYGPGGRVNRGEFVSTTYKCGPNDTIRTGCTTPGDSTLSRLPGVTEFQP